MKRFFAWMTALFLMLSCGLAFPESDGYLISLDQGTPIFKGPGEAYGFKQNVRVDGVYTIVEDRVGDDHFLWGRLKSGAGWVRVTDAPFQYEWRDVPYTVRIPAWVSMFEGPGYDFSYTGLVGMDGVYTIVDQCLDENMYTWGKLKSGAGWINLTDMEFTMSRPVIISFADKALLKNGEFLFCQADTGDNSEKIAVRANRPIHNMRFASLVLGEEFWETEKILYSGEHMDDLLPLVIEVTFPGDMTAFLFEFTDEYGLNHQYYITVSGRNGTLEVWEQMG